MTVNPEMDRRRFLRNMTLGAGATALTFGACSAEPFDSAEQPGATPPATAGSTPSATPAPAATPSTRITPANLDKRTLVVIELLGGNDGLDTVIPYNDPAYMDLRPNIGVDLETVIPLNDQVGLNSNLGALSSAPLAVVQGVGTTNPNLSHFESAVRWYEGNMTGSELIRTGFLGRLCDELHVGDAVTGLSIDMAPSPSLNSEKAVTLSIPDPSSGGWLSSDDDWMRQVRQGMTAMTAGDSDARSLLGTGRKNMAQGLDFARMLDELPDGTNDLYPGSYLSQMLSTCARLIDADTGVRVLHVPYGSFDTHDEHRGSHDYQLEMFGDALASFLTDLDQRGLAESTLVATISEFGRRPKENDGGTDHGAASVALLAGPVNPGVYGEYPSLTDLDEDDNLRTTVGMDEYYATLAESWFGIPATSVLAGTPAPLPELV